MFSVWNSFTKKVGHIIRAGAASSLTEKEFLEQEIIKWKNSPARLDMITGEKYYLGEHDILNRQRQVIGANGQLTTVDNLPNNKIIDNQYAKMVDQKVNYLLGKPLTFDAENKEYVEALKTVFDRRFHRTLKNLAEDALNGGIAWLHPYYNEAGELRFKQFSPYEIKPFWKDADHTELDLAARLYEVQVYEGRQEKTIEKVEVYTLNGIERYILQNNTLIPDMDNPGGPYLLAVDDQGREIPFNWERIPLIPFRYNNKEIPLIKRVKSLQDAINAILSDFQNNMQEDARNTILVIENYDGTDLGEFRYNLATYGAVKVNTTGDARGGVKTLQVEVNADNYKAILELLKKALIENARGFDAKDDRMRGNPNQMNIQSMYSDIDLDANGMETEFQAALEQLLWFVNVHFVNTGVGNFEGEKVNIIFNRDVLINESDAIENCVKSIGILSEETIISQHPWIDDVEMELRRKAKEKQMELEDMGGYRDAFPPAPAEDEGGVNAEQ